MLKEKLYTSKLENFIGQNLPKIDLAKKQKTIKKSVSFQGIGLHTGKKVSMTVEPAPFDTGYVFKVTDKSKKINEIDAYYTNVKSTNLCTLLADSKGNQVSTVEHVLSALYGLEIDNAFIKLDSIEIPICDGSSKEFVKAFDKVGYKEQPNFKKYVRILKKVEIKEGNKTVRVSPFDQTLITSEIDFEHKSIGKQSISLLLNPEIYRSQISSARTFGFLDQVEIMRKQGLALGGSLENAIVLDDVGVINSDGLRFSDEFVRHKVLDFVGDISLARFKILGSFFTSEVVTK